MNIRAVTTEDLQSIHQLLKDYDRSVLGEEETTEADVKNIIDTVLDLKNYSWVAVEEGQIIAFAVITKKGENEYPSLVIAHPDRRNEGIESELLHRMTNAIDEGTLIFSSNTDYEHSVFEENGFEAVRHWFRMEIDLIEKLVTPVDIPAGYQFETFKVERDEKETFEAFEDAFQTHFGFTPSDLESFTKRTEREGFDLNDWLLLKEGSEIAAFIFCQKSVDGHAEIANVGVRPKWRKRGFGKLLLQHAFHKLKEEGRPNVHLNVDSDNPTGAVQLYEGLGMKMTQYFVRYDKKVEKQTLTK